MVSTHSAEEPRIPRIVLALGMAVLVLEGYDIIMYGTVVPSLLTHPGWSITPGDAGHIGSLTVIGMAVGALTAAMLVVRIGRRTVLIASVLTFSLAMLACAAASSPTQLGVFRFVVGLGAGALLPTVVAMVVELSPAPRRGVNTAIAFVGVGIGGSAAGLLGTWIVPAHGFRPMFAIGALPALVVLPLLWRHLPESISYLRARGREDEALATATRLGIDLPDDVDAGEPASSSSLGALRAVFSRQHAPAMLLFCVGVFFCLLVLFGANAWLPALMIAAGYGVTSSLAFLLVLNIGATVGTLIASPIGDRIGFKPVVVSAFLAAAVSLALLATRPPTWAVIVLVALTGVGTNGTQILINAYIGSHFPADIRATALGIALGVGRAGGILGPTYGAMVIADLSPSWQFHAFAIPAAIGAAFTVLVPGTRANTRPPADAEPRATSRAR
jgi:AAHS family benzoate transporter-like MFS transporter